jgi:hypothetical protein
MTDQEQWVTMSEAAREIGVTLSKISRLASQGKIKTQANPFDERTRMVDLIELRKYFRIKDK